MAAAAEDDEEVRACADGAAGGAEGAVEGGEDVDEAELLGGGG